MVRAMSRLFFAGTLLALGACGAEEGPGNQRFLTLEYVTEGVLAPSCGNAQCHSSFRNEGGYAFDTVSAAKRSLEPIVNPDDPDASLLMIVLTRAINRMPYDQPLPAPDIAYLRRWIAAGAEGLDLP